MMDANPPPPETPVKHASLVLTIAALAAAGAIARAAGPGVRVTYLYDNTTTAPTLTADWGFACLVEGHGRTVLFDTGTKPEVLRRNMAALKVDAARIQALVFSHPHADHTLGAGALTALPGLPVYAGEHFRLPPDAEAQLARIGATRVTVPAATPVEVFPSFTVTGEMAAANTYEEALVIDTPAGAVVLVGCAHPGIVTMLQRVAEATKRPIHMVLGGFHLLQTPAQEVRRIIAEFKAMGVAWAGPAHCTGEEAIALFREAYGDHFIAGGVGTVVEVPRAGTRAR